MANEKRALVLSRFSVSYLLRRAIGTAWLLQTAMRACWTRPHDCQTGGRTPGLGLE